MWMSFPILTLIHLGYNKITRLNSIAKLSIPSLKTIYFRKFKYKKIQTVFIQLVLYQDRDLIKITFKIFHFNCTNYLNKGFLLVN